MAPCDCIVFGLVDFDKVVIEDAFECNLIGQGMPLTFAP